MSEVYALQPRVKESGATEKMSEEGKEGADALQTDKWLNVRDSERQHVGKRGMTDTVLSRCSTVRRYWFVPCAMAAV